MEEFGEWVVGMNMDIECELRGDMTSCKCAKLGTAVSISMDIFFFHCALVRLKKGFTHTLHKDTAIYGVMELLCFAITIQ